MQTMPVCLTEVHPPGTASPGVALGRELQAAVTHLTPVALGAARFTPEETGGSLLFYPAVGLALGVVTALVSGAVASVAGTPWGGVVAVSLLEAWSRGRNRRSLAASAVLFLPGDPASRVAALQQKPSVLGRAVAVAALAIKLSSAVRLSAPLLWAACLLAPLLGRWAMVVQAHGGRRDYARGLGAQLVGRADFREFAIASVTAFLVAMSSGRAVGLLLLVVSGLVTLGVRVLVTWRIGGFTGRLLGATAEMIETVVFAVMGGLAALGPV